MNIIHSLDSLQHSYPEAFKELAVMEPDKRRVMLALLNGLTTSPPARNYADLEVDKEDAIISSLRVNWGVAIISKRAHGNYCYHVMTAAQIDEFFNDRETMRKRVISQVWAKRSITLDGQLSKAIKWHGVSWLVNRIGELAANDPVYDVEANQQFLQPLKDSNDDVQGVKEQKEPKQ